MATKHSLILVCITHKDTGRRGGEGWEEGGSSPGWLGRTDTPHGEKINLVKILIFGLNILLFFANIDFDTWRTQLNVNMFLKWGEEVAVAKVITFPLSRSWKVVLHSLLWLDRAWPRPPHQFVLFHLLYLVNFLSQFCKFSICWVEVIQLHPPVTPSKARIDTHLTQHPTSQQNY